MPDTSFMIRILPCIFAVLLANCSKPLPPEFFNEPPTVSFTETPERTVYSPTVPFGWEGGSRWVSEFTYRLDDGERSAWTSRISWISYPLDEGTHTFVLNGRYPLAPELDLPGQEGDRIFPGQESDEISYTFTVDAIHGPALWLKPRHTTIAVGETVTLSVMAEDMTDLMLAHLEIGFDETMLGWEEPSVPESSLLARNGAQIIFLVRADETPGQGILDLGAVEGWPHGVDGSGTIATLRFRTLARGTAQVTLSDAAEVRDSLGQPLTRILEESEVVIE